MRGDWVGSCASNIAVFTPIPFTRAANPTRGRGPRVSDGVHPVVSSLDQAASGLTAMPFGIRLNGGSTALLSCSNVLPKIRCCSPARRRRLARSEREVLPVPRPAAVALTASPSGVCDGGRSCRPEDALEASSRSGRACDRACRWSKSTSPADRSSCDLRVRYDHYRCGLASTRFVGSAGGRRRRGGRGV